ncbi:hypothetical protein [Commensalibacter communis]|uniref:hypothetical protein n=1 Tax=Commensalibacter communis TaxID=2972786 RepID=UPI0022FFBCAE|nr:hypothetical protein [Commensalibacter communis]CAI3933301.1 unnamed protein product [Commensalibacter communis]CAI3944886.1 unnamed protein product [Commensalibacter communis]
MIIKPIQIKSINFEPDISWFTLQPPFIQQTIKQKFKNGAIDNNSYIVNKTKNTQLSLEEFAIYAKEKIVNKHYEDKQGVYGEILDNSYLKFIDSDLEVKLKGYNLTYCWDKPTKHNINIDLMQQILGIIHNYTTNKKQIVFKDGNIKNLD